MPMFDQPLPIDGVLGQLRAALARSRAVVLVAPPGAGKTTRVPLALLDEPWTAGGTIIVLEPRRLAARAAAERMAAMRGERVGDMVGLRVRLESRVSAATRIEVVTEGVFARRILDDPALEGVAAILFDEFHERSLDGDVGLALALDVQSGLREDLRLLVMSATLDGARVAAMMGDAPVVLSEGRAFPVETRYVGRASGEPIEDAVCAVVRRALREERGSILAFLPGQREIERAAQALAHVAEAAGVLLAPLYGALDREAQDRAVRPAPDGRRKVVLATSIAETSLTIEGVRVVIDSGVARTPVYEPDLGLTRLETVRSSRASADQRRGRAGRTEPGVCYRLWEEAANGSLPAFMAPEILAADLSGLVLDLAEWGVRDPAALRWLDPPPKPAWQEARALLASLGALEPDGTITDAGRAIRALPLPPRLARMVLAAAARGFAEMAATLALLLTERGLGGLSADLAARCDAFARDRSSRASAARNLARGWAKRAKERVRGREGGRASQPVAAEPSAGALVALAYPGRIAIARGGPGQFLMANGRAASLEPHDPLARNAFLAVAEIAGRASHTRILAAAAITSDDIERDQRDAIIVRDETVFDAKSASLRRRASRRLGALVLSEQALPIVPDAEMAGLLARGLLKGGAGRLPWSGAQRQMRRRIGFLRQTGDGSAGGALPDVSDEALAADDGWLTPFIVGRTGLSQVTADDLGQALSALLSYDALARLDRDAPARFTTPAGSDITIDYESDGGPFLDVRVQELFGLRDHPSVAAGRLPLTLRLLSPAHRPIQITRDLPGFWRGSWAGVRADMRGRYPRHVWPEDPAAAPPTRRAKPRGT